MNLYHFGSRAQAETDEANDRVKKFGKTLRCNKVQPWCLQTQCPHREDHICGKDCMRKVCMHDEREILVSCQVVDHAST
jgi:hypothetical protein